MIRVANAPCSWGVLEFEGMEEPADWAQVLDEIRECGYAGTELGDWGFLPTDPEILRSELQRRDLDLVGAFVPIPLARPHEADPTIALKTAHLLARTGTAPVIVLSDDNGTDPERVANAGRIRPDQGLEDWDSAAGLVTRIARSVREETGLRCVFHHHGAGYVETPDEVEALFSRLDPELVGLCLDTGHWAFGGGDPVAAMDRWGERIWHVHFKDFDPTRLQGNYFQAVANGVFCELGHGVVEFPGVLQRVRDGWIVVEQDVLPGMGSPMRSAQRNRSYLRSLGL